MKRRSFIGNAARLGIAAFASSTAFKTLAANRSFDNGDIWEIKQFKDSGLAHFSYAIAVNKKIILVDPGRDPEQYYSFAKEKNAAITGIIETHPHADFISSHLEIHQTTGATIYTSSLTRPSYKFQPFDDGASLSLGNVALLRSIATPGHAPDGISAILQVGEKDIAIFSGDSLLIGDVGRPDLREYSGDVGAKRLQLAKAMYHTLWNKFDRLPDNVVLYPAHGAGSLCGKNMRDAADSTIGYEKRHNYAFQKMTEQEFVSLILSDLPLIPEYFPYDVALNIKGAPHLHRSIEKVRILNKNHAPAAGALVVDGRPGEIFRQSHLPGAVNIPDGSKFETWLGTIVSPTQPFYLVAEDQVKLSALIRKTAKIGYEASINGASAYDLQNGERLLSADPAAIASEEDKYTIIDVRTNKESGAQPFFKSAINIPVNELRKRAGEIPAGKPIVVHCASGYRSAIASSILKKIFPDRQISDAGQEIINYSQEKK